MVRSNLILIVKVGPEKTLTYILTTSLSLLSLTGRSHRLLAQILMFIADIFAEGNDKLLKIIRNVEIRSLCKHYPGCKITETAKPKAAYRRRYIRKKHTTSPTTH